LNAINAANGLDFYQAILKIINKMQDRHHSFTPPFLDKFIFGIPFGIDSVPDPSGNGQIFKFINNQLSALYLTQTTGFFFFYLEIAYFLFF
jgi:hypothetical protein